MGPVFLRKYATGTGANVYLAITKRGVIDFAVGADWTPAAGDVKVSIDGGAAANITTLPTAVAMGNTAYWLFAFSNAELTGKRIVVTVADAATKAVEDAAFVVETFGNASALYPQDWTIAPGAAGGVLVVGSNSSVTFDTFTTTNNFAVGGNLTVTGTSTLTGAVSAAALVSLAKGLSITQSSVNGAGLTITGNGNGHAVSLSVSGAGNGNAVRAVGGAGNGAAVVLTAGGVNAAMVLTGGLSLTGGVGFAGGMTIGGGMIIDGTGVGSPALTVQGSSVAASFVTGATSVTINDGNSGFGVSGLPYAAYLAGATDGVVITGGTGSGVRVESHAGRGLSVTGGVEVLGGSVFDYAVDVSTTSGGAVRFAGGSDGIGVAITGDGTGVAVSATGGATADAVTLVGGATSGAALSLSSTVGDALRLLVESPEELLPLMRVLRAALVGASPTPSGGVRKYKSRDGSKDRVSATVSAGDRSAVSTDGS